jgi:hypothetical protein
MRRSGHHACIGWMKMNFDNAYGKEKCHYINDIMNNFSVKNELLDQKLNELIATDPKVIIVSYEDVNFNVSRIDDKYPTTKVVVLRDIHNLSASRYKANQGVGMRINELFVERWLSQANHNNIFKYEDFLLSKENRDAFMGQFSVENIDITNDVKYCSNIGSSFVGRQLDTIENYLNRHKMVDLPQELIDYISVPQVQEIRKRLGYI